jgi:hypothetical protein
VAATCDFRFSLQNRHATERFVTRLADLKVSNDAVTLSGRATRSEVEISQEEFVGANLPAIRDALTRFLTVHELPRANSLVILDMEPRGFTPRNLGDFEGSEQGDLIAAYGRRVKAARQVLRRTGPDGVRLGMYQVGVPVTGPSTLAVSSVRSSGCGRPASSWLTSARIVSSS